MNQVKRKEILQTMIEIGKQVDSHLDTDSQTRGNITYYKDLEFGNSGLGAQNVYIVETLAKNERKTGDNEETNITIYEIYDKDSNLIATVTEDGKIHFTPEYLESLKEIDSQYFRQLNLEDIDFKQAEELQEDDIVMGREELKEYEENQIQDNSRKEKINQKQRQEGEEETKDEDQKEQEETAKKEQAAEALGVDVGEIKSICTINPREKITDKYNLVDIMPEAEGYDEVSIVCSNPNEQSHGRFTIWGISKNGQGNHTVSIPLTSIEPVEGTESGKNVISVNEDGTEVKEKQVQGLFRINSRGRTDGLSVSLGDYGMMNVDYVENVMDKEHRRATPIRTKGPENVRMPSSQVRENAGDSIEEMEAEGRIFRAREKEGINPQSLDGIDIDKADGGNMTLEELKEYIKKETLEQGEMSKGETREFIQSKISQSGLELSDGEIEHITDEIEEAVLDESRFPTREHRG